MGCLENIKIYPITIDEWYGIEVQFIWNGQHDITNVDEKELAKHVAKLVVDSPEYKDFYKSEHTVACEEYEDGPKREVTIPYFQATDFTDWEFYEKGGWISSTAR